MLPAAAGVCAADAWWTTSRKRCETCAPWCLLLQKSPSEYSRITANRRAVQSRHQLHMPAQPLDEQIASWLVRLLAAQPPRADIVAFNVGLFETEDGYCAYL